MSTRYLFIKFFLFVFHLFSILQKKKFFLNVTLDPRHGTLDPRQKDRLLGLAYLIIGLGENRTQQLSILRWPGDSSETIVLNIYFPSIDRKKRLTHFILYNYIFSSTLNRDSCGRYTFPFAGLGNGDQSLSFKEHVTSG